jgi:hypothetical protein
VVRVSHGMLDNTQVDVTLLLDGGLYVSGVFTHRSVKWCLNPLNQHVENFVRVVLLVFHVSHITRPYTEVIHKS